MEQRWIYRPDTNFKLKTQKFTHHMIGLQLIQRATQVQNKEKLGAIY